MEHAIRIKLDAFPTAFSDPHNIPLAILICGGLAGWALWMAMYGVALAYCIRERHCAVVRSISAMIVFGLTASMTEGGAYLSRPKEHWFLVWIPLALLAGLWIARSRKGFSTAAADAAALAASSRSTPKPATVQ
jgi:O-antigen ligase